MSPLRSIPLILSCFLSFLGAGYLCAWEVSEYDGISYVPVREMVKVYNLSKVVKSANSMTLQNALSTKHSQYRIIKVRVGSKDLYMNDVRFVLSHSVIQRGGGLYISAIDITKIIDPVLRPQFIKNAGSVQTVILDPGHGGHDAGAQNSFVREADINLAVAKKLKVILLKSGFKVYLTRETDVFLTLQQRVNYANKFPHAIFVSIHHNSGRSGAHGIETFTLAPAGTSTPYSKSVRNIPLSGNSQDSMNIALASAVQGYTVRATSAEDRGIKRAHFSVLCTIKHPAILFEGGFVSNSAEARKISDEVYQMVLAKNMAKGIQAYRNVVNNKGESVRASISSVAKMQAESAGKPDKGKTDANRPLIATPTFNRGRKSCVID